MSRLQQLVSSLRHAGRQGRKVHKEKLPFKRTLLVETIEQRVLLAADPLSVARVAGSIDSAGEVDHYTFHLDNAARVSFDSLVDNGNLHWTLQGPSGTVVNQAGFQALSGNNGNYAPMDLAAGDYKIDVNANGDTTGSYDMRLLDLSRATPINLDTAVTGTFDQRAQTQAFVFDANAGDQLFLTWTQHPDTYLRVYDPYGQQVTSGYGQYGDGAIPALSYTGRYTILLDASNGVAPNTSYGFTLHRVVAPVQELGTWTNDAQAVSGTLAKAGDTAIIHFSLSSARSVLIDSLTNNDNLQLSLTGPNGQVYDSYGQAVSNRGLANYLDHGYYGTGQIDLVAGNYTMVVSGSTTTTGDYSLRLLNLAGGTTISKSTVVSGQLNPGNQAQIYHFNATAGDNINFDAISNTGGNPSVKLLAPYGRRVSYGFGFSDLNNLTLSATGSYTLVVSGENNRTDPTSYSFQLVDNGNTPVVLPTGAAYNVGDTVTATLGAGGGSTVYNFTLASPTTLYFDPQAITPNSDAFWNLQGPRGSEMGDSYIGWYNGYEGARVVTVPAGTYALTIHSTQALSVPFRLLNIATSAAPIALNTPVTGQLNPGNGVAAYSFDATAGQHVFFQSTSTDNGQLRWRLVDPYGHETVGNTGWGDWENNLAYSGKYTLLIEGYNNIASPINYQFSVFSTPDKSLTLDPAVSQNVAPSWTLDGSNPAVQFDGFHDIQVPASPTLNLTQDVSIQARVKIDRFDQTWQSIVYKGPNTTDYNSRTYTLWVNAAGYFYLTTSDNSGQMDLSTANGSVKAGQWYDVTGVIDRSSGLMKIFINGVEAASTTIRTTSGNARVQDTPLYIGNAHEGWGSNDNQLEGAIADVRVWDKALKAADITGMLSTPPSAADSHLKLWLKLDEGSGASVVDASSSGLGGTIINHFAGLPGVVVGSVDVPGQQVVYHLSLPQAKTFYIDTLTPSFSNAGSNLQLAINGPRTNINENLTYFNNRLVTLQAGDYTFTVDGNGRATGPYAFRLIDQSSAQSFNYGDTVSGTLNPGDTAKLYTFNATAGDAIYFQSLGSSGFNPAWRLVDPFGREVFGRTGLGDRDTSTLAYTGTYTLIIDGDYSNFDQKSQYSFKLINTQQNPTQTFDIVNGLDAGVQRTTGQDGGAVQLSDAQYIEFPDGGATDQTGSFTMETSFRIDRWSSGSWIPLLTKTTSDALRQIGVFINNDGRIHIGSYPDNSSSYSSVESPSGTVTAGGWHKLAAVYDRVNSQLRIVLDGQLVASGYLNPEAAVNLSDPMRVGYNTEGYDFYGYQVTVDQLAVWNKALTTPEVVTADSAQLTGSESNLVALYKFNEASGTAVTDTKGGASGSIVRLASKVGGLVTGRITQPGETQRYQFTLSQASQLYFDSLTRRSDIHWTLSGPTVSMSDTFYSGDSNNGRNLISLPAGTYTITIDADGAATGDYMFRLLDAASAQHISLDQVVNGQLDPGQVSKIYTFDATAGQQVYFDTLSYTSQQPAWRLLDPTGAQVFGVNWFTDRDTTTLSRTGTYTLIVEDYTSSGSRNPTRNFSFDLRTVSDVNKTITLGTSQLLPAQWTSGPVAGEPAIQLDGSKQVVTAPSSALDLTNSFTVEAMVKVDSFANTWTPIVNRAAPDNWNQQTFGLYVGSSGQVNLDSNANGSGWYIGSANGVVQLGQWYRLSATVNRSTGIAKIYVNGVEVASSNINTTPATSNPNLPLHVGTSDLSNSDRGELHGAVSDVRVWNVARSASDIAAAMNTTMTGSETGLVYNLKLDEGSGSTVADSSANHISSTFTSLYNSLGSTVVEGSIAQVGSRVIYTINPTTDKQILFDTLTPDNRFSWSLIGPDGTVVDNYNQTLSGRSLRDSDAGSRTFFNLKAGQSYQLIVDASGDTTGNFAYRLADFADATSVAYDTPTTWTTTQARATQLYSFNGTAGDQIVLDRINYMDPRPLWRLFDPAGREIFSNDFYYDSGTLTLALTGRYTLALEGYVDSRGAESQTFQVQKVGTTTPPALPTGTSVTFSNGTADISGTTLNINEPQVFNFTLAAPTRIYIDALNSSYPQYYHTWTLTGPNGQVDSRWSYDTDGTAGKPAWYDLPAGTYAFSVATPYTWAVGAFKFRLLDFASAQAITIGTNVTDTLSQANSTKVYSFSGTASDRLYFNPTAQSNVGSDYWRVINADTGAVLAGNYFSNGMDGVVLNRTGNYLLTMEGYYGNTGAASYGFTVYKNTDTTQALTLGSTVSGTLTQPGDTQRYTFTLNAATKLWFDGQSNTQNLSWRVLDQDGVAVLGNRDTREYPWQNVSRFDLASGNYTLVIDGNGAATGTYSFRLSDLASAKPITPGTTVNGQLAPASETDLYQFSANAGDSFFFDQISRSGGNPYWRLIDPFGQTVWGTEGFYDHGTTTLSYTGTYTLAIEGYPDDTGTINYSFNVTPVVQQAPVVLAIGVLPAPNLVVQNLNVAGADGSVHSGGALNVSWTTANTGDRDVTAPFQERVVVKNAGGETLVNMLVPYDEASAGPIVAGASKTRSATVQLPSGARGAGQLTVSVFTDVANAIAEQGSAGENDNSTQTTVSSTLLTYPDLTVSNVALAPSSNLGAGDQATLSWHVNNSGDKASSQAWSDRVLVVNTSTGEVVLDQTTRVDAASATLAAGGSLNRQLVFNWPSGRKGSGTFAITVTTDVLGEIAEYNATDTGEANNSSTVNLTNAPDLQVSNLQVLNSSPVSGDTLNLQWTVLNQGNAPTPQGWFDRVQVYNQTTGDYLVNVDVAYDPVTATGSPLAAGGSATRTFSVKLPDGVRAVGDLRITVSADQNAAGASTIPESNEGNNDANVVKAVTAKPYPNLTVSDFTAPATQRSGDSAHFSWTVTNTGTAATNVGAWADRVILSSDAIIGNGDDIVLATVAHNGTLAANGSYTATADAVIPGSLDGNYHLAVVTDALSAVTEPDTRADNTSALKGVLLTAYHADLVASFTSVPTSAVGGDTMTVSWHVDNTGDATTNGSGWYDQLWMSTDGTLGAGAINLGTFAHSGAIGAGQGYDVTQQITVPNGHTGAQKLIVVTDAYNYIFESRFDGNNTAVSTTTVQVSAAPAVDLSVQSVTAPATMQPGQTQTVSWTVRNTGAGTAHQPWVDQLYVSRDGTLANAIYLGSATRGSALNGADSYQASLQFAVPDLGDGDWRFVVVTDAGNQVYETGAADSETANTGMSAVATVTHPDLLPTDLSVTTLTGGQAATMSWTDRNQGSGAVTGSWTDKVYLSTSATFDGNAQLLGQLVVSGGLAAGASAAQTLSITPPVSASGTYYLFVVSDANNQVRELSGESNNVASVSATVNQAPLPDLTVGSITGPATGLAGRNVPVSWTVSNAGDLAAKGDWSEQVWLSSDDAIGGDQLLGSFFYSANNLAAGASVTRTENVTLPTYAAAGNYKLVVRVDTGNTLAEHDELNNAAIASTPLNIGAALSLSLSTASIGEQAGANALTGTLVRSGATTSALTVQLSSNLNGLNVPATVVIPAGQASVNFNIGVTDNTIVDGNRDGLVTATSSGFADVQAGLRITDNDVPALSFSAPVTTVDEGYGPLTVTVTRNTVDVSSALEVAISNTKSYKLTSPDKVVIAAGASSATFQVTPVNDTYAEGNRNADLTGTAQGYVSAGLRVQILDNDIPSLTLNLASSVVSEGGGVAATHGTLTRSLVTDSPVTVGLSSEIGRVRLPNYVTFQAGQASVDFDITVIDNDVADGDHQVFVGAFVVDAFSSKPIDGTQVQKTLLITDNDGPTLSLSIDKNVVAEAAGAGAATATVTRNTPTDTDLTVHLSSTDTTEATVQTTVVIPAGQKSVSFAVNAVQDGVQDGSQNAAIVASATGFNSGSVSLQVTDSELADLQVSTLNTPTSIAAGATMALSWTVSNAGLGAANSTWVDNVYLSNDNVLSADDQLVGSYSATTPLAIGASYTRSITVGLGAKVGDMWAFVVTDSGNSQTELTDGNNLRGNRISVTPPYTATVSTDVTQIGQGKTIAMTGNALDAVTGLPKTFVPVDIRVMTNGMTRTITAIADKNGHFSANFTPLPSEAGHYTIAAVYPGDTGTPAQDSFDIIGMQATNGISASLIPGQSVTGQLTIKNLSPVDLHGVQASVSNLPPGITLTFDGPVVLNGNGTLSINYTLSAAADMQALSGSTSILISSDEGAQTSASLSLSVNPLRPQLVSNPGYVTSGMLVGGQTTVSFEVTNTGGAATGPLQVLLPTGTTWLSLASDQTIASLAPGEKAKVTLVLTPGQDLPLQRYDGSVVIAGSTSSVTVPFQFRAVSEAKGDVQVTVTDEYTYFADNKPNLAGATVQLLDPYTYDVVATAVTDATGIVTFKNVAEGPYTMQVSAPQHDSYRATVQVTPGGLATQEVFLHRQAVTYNWTVVPTEVQDHYKIVLESTFETEVPMPVVTVDQPFIMPWVIPGYDTQFNITLTNHGLINATQVQIKVPDDPDYIITPLVKEIPVLAAKSSVTIPVTIRLRDSAAATASTMFNTGSGLTTSGPGSALIKCLGMSTVYTYQCKDNQWVEVPIRLAPTVGCLEGLKDVGKSIPEYLLEKSAGNLLSAGCDVISMALDCLEAAGGPSLSDCQTAILTSICKAAAGAAAGGPAGAAAGVLSNWSDILACLCSLDWGGLGGGGSSGPGGGGDGGGWGWGGGYGGPGSPYTTPVSYSVPQTGCSGTASSSTDTNVGTQSSNGVCAQVRLRIEQEAVIERTAFLGTLEVDNGHADISLDKVSLTLDIRDAQGNSANDKFLVRGPTLKNITVNPDGTYSIAPSTNGSLQFTFVPKDTAAPDAPTIYNMGGILHYIDNGTAVDVPLLPAKITVQPEAKLNLDYFWQRDVIGDDPFTDQVEPSQPFALGLQVTNVGKGGAGDLTITSAQPQIIENEKGLLVDFKIIGSQVGDKPGTNSLTVDLGNIAPGQTQTAQWNLISSLQGKFKDFSATFEHIDDNGDLSTSLIQKVNIHELTRAVYVTSPKDDHIPDYLANDVPDADNQPDTLYMSTGGQAPVTLATNATMSSSGLTRTVTATMQSGWSYLTVADALPGYELTKVVRSDGKVLPIDGMVWRTNRTFKQNQPGAINENLVHLLDLDSTGSYTFTYAIVDHVPPTVDALTGIAGGVHTDPVDTVDVTFSEPIDDTTISKADVHLTLNGTEVSVPDLTVSYVSGNTWRLSGLGSATGADGNYHLSIDGHGITDLAGNAGTNLATVDWAMGATAPVITTLQAVVPVLRNTPVTSVDVTFSRAMDPTSLDWTDLLLTRDGQAVNLNSGITISQLNDNTFRINGLDSVTTQQGSYVLSVRASSAADKNGVAGIGQMSTSWQVDTTAPAVLSLEQLTTNPRNTVVMSLDVSFSEPIDASTFDWHDITLTRSGSADNLITSDVTVEQVDATTWRIKNFNWKVGLDGVYTLTVKGAGIKDVAGNVGTGTVSESWTMDINAPAAPTHVTLSPDTGASSTDGRTNTTKVGISGDLGEAGLAVRLSDTTTNAELGYATVTHDASGDHFTSAFNLSGPGAHKVRVRVVDPAGNIATDTFVDVFVDMTAPGVASVANVSPNPRTTPVDTVDFTFDEAIDGSTLDASDLSLTRDGVAVDLSGGVTVSQVSGNTWRVSGLSGKTTDAGAYVLTVSASGVADIAGNAGVGSKSTTWTTQGSLPTGIRGKAYEDLDGSGTYNPASYNPETMIAGRVVFLDANNNGVLDSGEVSTTTGADGSYAFDNIAAGSYHVRQVLPTNWILTAPSSGGYDVTLTDGHTVSGADFGNFQTGTISGVKFNDLNADGTREAGEGALAGWTVFLDANANGQLDAGEASTVTAADGSFSFSHIGPGTYSVGEVLPNTSTVTWQRTTPAVPYNVKSGFAITADQGDVQLGSISGTKVNDLNGNGLRDAGEPGIAGWTIFLDNNGNGVLDAGEISTVTDANGNYTFKGLLPGHYIVAEEQRTGWVQTTPLPAPAGVNVTTAGSNIALEADCACGAQWATSSGTALVDYGKLSIDTALATTGITSLRQDPKYANLDGRGQTTVVIDTGIDLNHSFFGPDLNGDGVDDRIVYQYDFANDDTNASDRNGHGSNVASIIGSQDGNYPGVAPDANLIALKVFDDQGHGYFSYLEKALQWVIAHHDEYNVGVVNLSLGDNGNWTDELSRYGIGDELAALAQTDVIVVAAAGNNYLQFGKMGVAYPASDPAAIAVGATWSADFGGPWTVSTGATNYSTGADEIAAFSQRDTKLLDTFAPGARFNGANATGGITTMQGTSQAAAFVSGAATLAQQVAHQTLGRGLTTGEFATLLRNTGDLIMDGDDEVDNVVNTGQKFPRLDMVKLVAAISSLKDQPADGSTGNSGSTSTPTVVQQAAAGVRNVSLTAGDASNGQDFGNFQLGTVSGTVFSDTSRDGNQQAGETGKSGVTVFLDANGNGTLDTSERSVLTDAQGAFSFGDIGPGPANVRIVVPDGLSATTDVLHSLVASSGMAVSGLNYGLAPVVQTPVAHDDSVTIDEDTIAHIDVLANDSTTGATTLTLGNALHGTVSLDADGKVRYAPTANFNGDDQFSYTVSEAGGARSATAVVRVHVNPVNDAPVLDAIPNQVVAENGTLSLDLHASDVDDTVLNYSLLQAPQGATLDLHSGHLTWAAADQSAPQTFAVQVSDAGGLTSVQHFTVQVQLGKLVVTGFANTAWGFTVRFNDVVDPSALNVYGAQAPDVTVTGTSSGVVKGSVVFDDDGKGFSFIRTGAQLATDSYKVMIRGAADGVTNSRRGALDGDVNGTAGGNYTASFTVAAAPAVRLRLPDFARGPGQTANVPNTTTGIPITLSSDGTVTEVRLRIKTDVDTLTVSEIRRGADLPADATLTVTPVSGSPGQFDVTIKRSTALPVGASLKLLAIIGTVPNSARLGDAGAIVLDAVSLNGVAAPQAGDAAVDIVAYPGDMDFDGAYTANDATLVGRVATGLTTSLPQIDDLDASIVADVDASGTVNALDTALVLARTKVASTPAIPAVPVIPPIAPLASLSSSSTSGGNSGSGSTTVDLGGSFSNFSLASSSSGGTSSSGSGSGATSTASLSATPTSTLRVVPSTTSTGVSA